MATGKLSDTAARNARPRDATYRMADGGGMFLEVRPDGARYWRQAYRFAGKQKLLALGVYPDTSLRQAREKRDAARKLIAAGTDPAEQRKGEKLATSGSHRFDAVARAWMVKAAQGNAKRPPWSERYADRVRTTLEGDLFPVLGAVPVGQITAKMVRDALRPIEKRGALHSAVKAKGWAAAVMGYAVAEGLAERNPVADLPADVIDTRPVKHHAAVTDPAAVGKLLRDIRAYSGHYVTRCALELLPLVFTRPGELRNAEWCEFDLDGTTWEVPAGRMKQRASHVVPLSRQAVAILRQLHAVTGRGRLVFPSVRHADKPLSENTVNAALRGLGYDSDTVTGHGFRATARTLLAEQLGVRVDLIEHQLAHTVRDPLGRAYNRTEFVAERRKMMQRWADYLDQLATGADVVKLPRRRV